MKFWLKPRLSNRTTKNVIHAVEDGPVGHSCRGGSSLVELSVLLGIFSITASLAIPNLFFLNKNTVRFETEKLCMTFNYLRQKAIASGEQELLKFDKARGVYSYDGHVEKLPASVQFGFVPRAKGPPGDPKKALKDPVTFKGCKVIFYPTGIIDSGSVYLTDSKKSCGYALSNAISQISYLRGYRFDCGSWVRLE